MLNINDKSALLQLFEIITVYVKSRKTRRKEYKMAFAGMCPYLKEARDSDRTICECARFTFPDRVARREVLYGFCGHPDNWKECTFKAIMDHYYDRKYSTDGEAEAPLKRASKRQR